MTTARYATKGITMTKNCHDCGTRITSRNRAESPESGLCDKCYDYAGWENTHSDWGHDRIAALIAAGVELDDQDQAEADSMTTCPVCQGNAPTLRTHDATPASSWSSHKGHDHEATSKARAACRKAQAAG